MTCLGCIGQPGLSEQCGLNHPLQGLRSCLQERCAAPCGLSSGTSSSSSGAGTSSSSSSSSASTSSSSSGAGTSSSTSASSGGPITCDSVDGAVGCCDSTGVLHYCDTLLEVVDQTCADVEVCGWDPFNGWYDCVLPPGGPDPSGSYPLSCGF
jgi:hypothetical protein